ncbi:MAG: GvpL/GvpF family gas vesicle protein [Nocardioidaceae bacterium]|nr:GvpL/GvpF family gas vesicle protein [Nocardioidaceae bacterium]
MAESGRYLYAVTRGTSDAPGTGLRGAPLRDVEHRGLVAVVSEVDLDEFGEDGLKRHLEDLAWLEEVARTHDDVVREVARRGVVAPLRLATICRDDDGVRERLDEWHDGLTGALDRVEGRAEWSVKLYVEAAAPDERPADEPADGPGAGAAYLMRKRTASKRRQESEQQAVELAEKLHELACGRAVASRRLAAQDPRLTGHAGTMVLNGAYLVPADDESFASAVEAFAEGRTDVRVEVQGPWPPYSFATLDSP